MAKILVAEDDPAIAEMICDVLTEEGHAIVWARDGVDALARAAEGPFDLILADLMMPRLDGRSLRTALAAEPTIAQTPMILMTAASNLLDSDERQFAGVLAKPFYIDALLDALGQHLSPAIAGADPEEPE